MVKGKFGKHQKVSKYYENDCRYSHGTIVNIYIVYEKSKNYNISSYPTLENYLFGAVSLTNLLMVQKFINLKQKILKLW